MIVVRNSHWVKYSDPEKKTNAACIPLFLDGRFDSSGMCVSLENKNKASQEFT